MQNIKVLNRKETKEILGKIEEQWGCELKLDYVFLMNEQDKILIVNREVFDLELSKMRVNSIGLYFGESMKDGLRLSIEGSQILGPYAKKNVLELPDPGQWLMGVDIDFQADVSGYVILKSKDDYLGCGKSKNGKILNYIPKTRRLRSTIQPLGGQEEAIEDEDNLDFSTVE